MKNINKIEIIMILSINENNIEIMVNRLHSQIENHYYSKTMFLFLPSNAFSMNLI